jgi:hypothetical protein
VLGFLKPPGAGVDGVPLQQLFGFERIHLKAGAEKTRAFLPFPEGVCCYTTGWRCKRSIRQDRLGTNKHIQGKR